ncbi:MAG TPA: hypothetical protein PK765_01640 [bacterium]|nr:hypothetical protein [bacterium]
MENSKDNISAADHPTKTVSILYHNNGRLGNQLWLYASVLAYAFHEGCSVENPSFFEYARYFRMECVQ